jgi:uncharacterized membrane protein
VGRCEKQSSSLTREDLEVWIMSDGLEQLLQNGGHGLTEAESRALYAVLRRQTGELRNINELTAQRLTPGERASDAIARQVGSWRFIIVQSILLVTWLVINSVGWIMEWDPYPFILLNLMLSFQAAFTAPVIMMSQNRQEARDRLESEQDYAIDRRAELEVTAIHARLDELAGRQWEALVALQHEQLEVLKRIEALTIAVHQRTTTS